MKKVNAKTTKKNRSEKSMDMDNVTLLKPRARKAIRKVGATRSRKAA